MRKRIIYRNLKSLDHDSFQTCIHDSLVTLGNSVNLDQLIEGYTQSLTTALDKHAPQKTRLITVRPCAAWYTDEIADAKKQRR